MKCRGASCDGMVDTTNLIPVTSAQGSRGVGLACEICGRLHDEDGVRIYSLSSRPLFFRHGEVVCDGEEERATTKVKAFFFFREKGPEGKPERRCEIVCQGGGFIVYAKEDAEVDIAWKAMQKFLGEPPLEELQEILVMTATAIVEIPEH